MLFYISEIYLLIIYNVIMKLKLYSINIPDNSFSITVWSVNPKKALKEAINIAFNRRGISKFKYDNKEFITTSSLYNYLIKKEILNQICIEITTSIFNHN